MPNWKKVVTSGSNASLNQITASAFQFIGSGTAELEVQGHITASGNISSSGTIQSTGNITTDGELSADTIVVGSTISHIGDTNTLISFGTDTLTFKAGNEAFITITEDGSQDNIVIGDGGDIDFHVKAGGDNTLFAQGSSQNIGIGTATPGEKLEVITPSGNYQIPLIDNGKEIGGTTGNCGNCSGASDPSQLGLDWDPTSEWIVYTAASRLLKVKYDGTGQTEMDPISNNTMFVCTKWGEGENDTIIDTFSVE